MNTPLQFKPRESQLYHLGKFALAGLAIFLWYRSPLESMALKGLGTAILVFAFMPLLRWAKLHREWFPAFEIMLLTTAVFYAAPLLSGHPATLAMPSDVLLRAGIGVIIYQVAAMLVFESLRHGPRVGPWFTASLLTGRVGHLSQIGLWINTLYLYASSFTDWIPWEFASIIRAGAYGIGIVSVFVQGRLYGAGELSLGEKLIFLGHIMAQSVFLLTGIYLIQVLGLVTIALIGRVSAKRSIPVLPIVIVLPLAALLHTGKSAMREAYWADDAQRPTVTQLPEFFSQWVRFAFDAKANSEAEESMGARFAERASLYHMLAFVITRIPDYDPYLSGDTYLDIPAQIVPRALWPNKPAPHLSNIRLAIYFGFVTEESASKVSIAFGIPTEAYANFGLLGMALVGAIMGYLYKTAALLSVGQPIFSAAGLLMIVLTAWSFQAELVLATWFASMFQACVMVVGVPLLARQLGLTNR